MNWTVAPDDWPRVSRAERLILSMLTDGERYGLELVADSNGRLKRGTVYVTLGRMEQKGLVESRIEASGAGGVGPARRLYSPTPLGKRILRAAAMMRKLLAVGVAR